MKRERELWRARGNFGCVIVRLRCDRCGWRLPPRVTTCPLCDARAENAPAGCACAAPVHVRCYGGEWLCARCGQHGRAR